MTEDLDIIGQYDQERIEIDKLVVKALCLMTGGHYVKFSPTRRIVHCTNCHTEINLGA